MKLLKRMVINNKHLLERLAIDNFFIYIFSNLTTDSIIKLKKVLTIISFFKFDSNLLQRRQ